MHSCTASWGLCPRRLDRFAVPRAFGPPARHPPGLRPRPTASPTNGPPEGAIQNPRQGRGLPPPLSGPSGLPVRLPRKGLRPSPPLRGGSPPQQPAFQKENCKFRAFGEIAFALRVWCLGQASHVMETSSARRVRRPGSCASDAVPRWVAVHRKLTLFLQAGWVTVPPLQLIDLLSILAFFTASAALWGHTRRRLRRRRLWLRQRDLATLKAMSWQEFELLVGETFRRLGYRVQETGGGGADGGADLLLSRNGHRFVVQCKHYKTVRVGVPVVREVVGVAVHEKAQGAFVVTVGSFTKAAKTFASGKPLHLIDGPQLLQMVTQGRAQSQF